MAVVLINAGFAGIGSEMFFNALGPVSKGRQTRTLMPFDLNTSSFLWMRLQQIREVLPSSSVQQGTGSPTNNASSTPKGGSPTNNASSTPKGCCGLFRRGRPTKKKVKRLGKQSDDSELRKKRNTMMVVSVLIATVSYQASLNPPGGFWQDNKTGNETLPRDRHVAGTAINSSYVGFQGFMVGNSVALFASLVVILCLTSARTIKWRRLMWMLMALMWISVLSIALSFFCGALIILNDVSLPAIVSVVSFGLACMVLFAVVLLLNAFFGLKKICRWLKKKLGLQSQNVDPVSSSLPLQ